MKGGGFYYGVGMVLHENRVVVQTTPMFLGKMICQKKQFDPLCYLNSPSLYTSEN